MLVTINRKQKELQMLKTELTATTVLVSCFHMMRLMFDVAAE